MTLQQDSSEAGAAGERQEYNVHFTGYVSHVETVEAGSPEEAIANAETGSVSLCNQCTRDWDSAGDVDVSAVTDAKGEEVWREEAPAAAMPSKFDLAVAIHDHFHDGKSCRAGITCQKLSRARSAADAVLNLTNGSAS